MAEVAFVLGNGESRKGIQIEDLKKNGTVYACNGVYRTDNPDHLVAVDPKMMMEIAETDYMIHNKVHSNFNTQYNNNQKILDHVKWFQPSLGWSSGPTALRLACDMEHNEIYILGFDYQGLKEKTTQPVFKFNNLFKDTRNYKRSKDEATFFGNWMSQTKRCFADYKNVNFIRVVPKGWYSPKDLEWNGNASHITTDDFLSKFNLELKI